MRKDIGLGKRRKPIEKKPLGLLLPPLLISGVDKYINIGKSDSSRN